MDIKDLGGLALTLAIAGIIISFTLLVQSEVQEEMCPSSSLDFAEYPLTNSSVGQNPVTGTYWGCCDSVNSTNSTACNMWVFSEAFNASGNAIDGVAEFSGWFVIIALAIVFAVILGIIMRYIGAGRE